MNKILFIQQINDFLYKNVLSLCKRKNVYVFHFDHRFSVSLKQKTILYNIYNLRNISFSILSNNLLQPAELHVAGSFHS